MSKRSKISNLRTQKRLEQQSIDVAKGQLDTAVKPIGPTAENNVKPNR